LSLVLFLPIGSTGFTASGSAGPASTRPGSGVLPPDDPRAQLDPALLLVPPVPQPRPRPNGAALHSRRPSREVEYMVATRSVQVGALLPSAGRPGRTAKGDREVDGFRGRSPARIQSLFGPDDRVQVVSTSYPQRTQCKLVITWADGQQSIGSATLIGARHALTAGHCVHNAERGGWAERIQVIPGLSGTYMPYGSVDASNYRTYTTWIEDQNRDDDWSLLTLGEAIGDETGWLGYAARDEVKGLVGHISGYPGDQEDGDAQFYSYGPIDDATDYQVLHQIDTMAGQSGSGIYQITDDGRFFVFAVHTWGGEESNGGTRLESAKFESIERWQAADE
jgi:V8-like Glu-specific endopeptidase